MGVNTDYLGHIEIVPNLNQAEYDYLHAFANSRRGYRPGGPYADTPADPHTGSSAREVERYNQIAEGQPGYWSQWVPCPRGCCLGWNGNEKFYAGASWLQYLIDHFLRRGVEAQGSGDPQFTEFSFDHEMKGVIVGEQQDSREVLLLRVEQDQVTKQILRRGDPVRPASAGIAQASAKPSRPRMLFTLFQSCPSNVTKSHLFSSAHGPFATSCVSSTAFM